MQPSLPRFDYRENQEIHNRIASFAENCKEFKVWGMASIYPHFTQEQYRAEAYRCIRELGFVGLKMTPIGHAVNPESEDGMFAFSVADELGVPMMVHTGSGIPFSDPLKVLKAAKQFPNLKIVLAHAGMGLLTHQAIYVASECENVYLEPSWVGIFDTNEIYRQLGAERMMFSSDHVNNVPVELAKYREIISDSDLEQVLWKTANSVYQLDVS